MLQDGNIQELVRMVREELTNLDGDRRSRADAMDGDLREMASKLDRLYEALETGNFGLEDLTQRVRMLRQQQEQLSESAEKVQEEIPGTRRCGLDIQAIKKSREEIARSPERRIGR